MTNLERICAEVIAAGDKAHREICDLAKGKRWDMCVPVQPTDSDIVLQKPLDYIDKLARAALVMEKALQLYSRSMINDCRNLEIGIQWIADLELSGLEENEPGEYAIKALAQAEEILK